MDTATPQSGHLVLPLSSAETAEVPEREAAMEGVPLPLAEELWRSAEAELCGLEMEEFREILAGAAARCNCGAPPGTVPGAAERAAFLRGLRLGELALAAGCGLGREAAWRRFLGLYRAPLTQAAIAIAGSTTVGHDLADSLYAELYGLRTTTGAGAGAGGGAGGEAGGERRSPLLSYTGRGSLLGWLRATLAQRHVDHHRRTRRETALDGVDAAAPEQAPAAAPGELARVAGAVERSLRALGAEDRFLLSAYFLDRQTLLQIARTLGVHEATVSRRIKRLTGDLRRELLRELQAGGMSRRAAEEALGTDPRDVEINLRPLLQSSGRPTF